MPGAASRRQRAWGSAVSAVLANDGRPATERIDNAIGRRKVGECPCAVPIDRTCAGAQGRRAALKTVMATAAAGLLGHGAIEEEAVAPTSPGTTGCLAFYLGTSGKNCACMQDVNGRRICIYACCSNRPCRRTSQCRNTEVCMWTRCCSERSIGDQAHQGGRTPAGRRGRTRRHQRRPPEHRGGNDGYLRPYRPRGGNTSRPVAALIQPIATHPAGVRVARNSAISSGSSQASCQPPGTPRTGRLTAWLGQRAPARRPGRETPPRAAGRAGAR